MFTVFFRQARTLTGTDRSVRAMCTISFRFSLLNCTCICACIIICDATNKPDIRGVSAKVVNWQMTTQNFVINGKLNERSACSLTMVLIEQSINLEIRWHNILTYIRYACILRMYISLSAEDSVYIETQKQADGNDCTIAILRYLILYIFQAQLNIGKAFRIAG